ncbi:MAG: hypothetical protein WCE79_23090 [Xanthobacteraceae bacterium]
MDFSLAGLIGSALAIVAGMTSYFLTVPVIEKRLRELGPKDTPEQRHDLEFKLGVMRRLILTLDVVVFGLIGYWVGKAVAG